MANETPLERFHRKQRERFEATYKDGYTLGDLIGVPRSEQGPRMEYPSLPEALDDRRHNALLRAANTLKNDCKGMLGMEGEAMR